MNSYTKIFYVAIEVARLPYIRLGRLAILVVAFAFSIPAVSAADGLQERLLVELDAQTCAFSNTTVHYSLIEEYGHLSESGAVVARKIDHKARAKGREVSREFLDALSRREEWMDGHVFIYAGNSIRNQYGVYTEIQRVAGGVEKDVADLDGKGLAILHHVAMKSFPFVRYIQIEDPSSRVLYSIRDRELQDNLAVVSSGNGATANWSRDPVYIYVARLRNAIHRAVRLEETGKEDCVTVRLAYDNGSAVLLDCCTNGPFKVQMSSSYDKENRLLSKTEFDQFTTNVHSIFPHKIVETKYDRHTGETQLRTIIQVGRIEHDQALSDFTFSTSTNGIRQIRDHRLTEK